MTDPVIPDIPPAPVVPPYPALGAPNFNQMAYDVGTGMPGVVSGLNAIAAAARECALASRAYAQSGDGSRQQAEAAAAAATVKAGEALGSASAASGSASAASGSAGAAAGSASTASTQAGIATAQAGNANTARLASEAARDASVAARDAAQGYRDQAAVFATQQIKGSSTTSVTPGAGAKSFTIEASRSFVVGMYVVATSQSDPATSMSGYVQSYNPTSGAMVIGVDVFSGASAKADWVIGVAAPGAASGLTRQVVTANTTCVAGVAYIVAAAGITLTLPTSWAAGDKIAFVEAIGPGALYNVAFGSTPLRGRVMGTQQMSAMYGGSNGVLTYQDATRGLV